MPDFASTVHAITGGQLPALIGEMDSLDATPTEEDALKGYIIMSRVQSAENIAIAQPFPPALFRQGQLESANLLLRVLRGEVVGDEAIQWEWLKIAQHRAGRSKRNALVAQKWPCGMCEKVLSKAAYVLGQGRRSRAILRSTY